VLALILVLQGQGDRAHAALPSSIAISLNNPDCVEVLPQTGMCSIEINNLSITGSDPSFSRAEVLVNGKLRVEMNGFFESTGYLGQSMVPGGLKVACGLPNAGGLPDFGKVYQVTANAYMADGTSASDSLNVACPAFVAYNYFPVLRK
jgi:hypothetical protein